MRLEEVYFKYEYHPLDAKLHPRNIEESNATITGIVDKIKKYENEYGRKIKVCYHKYRYIPENLKEMPDLNQNLAGIITGATFHSTSLKERFNEWLTDDTYKWNPKLGHVVYGEIETNFDESTKKLSEIKLTLIFNPKFVNPKLNNPKLWGEYEGLARIIQESEI